MVVGEEGDEVLAGLVAKDQILLELSNISQPNCNKREWGEILVVVLAEREREREREGKGR